MAKKAPEATSDKQPKGSKILGLLRTSSFVLTIISATILFVGAYDYHLFDVRMIISKFAIVCLPVFTLSAVLYGFAQSKFSATQGTINEDALMAGQTDLDLKIKAANEKLDEYLGDEFKQLKSENETLKAEFERMKQSEREKLEEENTFLKEQNSILKQQITSKPNGTAQPTGEPGQLAVMED